MQIYVYSYKYKCIHIYNYMYLLYMCIHIWEPNQSPSSDRCFAHCRFAEVGPKWVGLMIFIFEQLPKHYECHAYIDKCGIRDI